MPDAPPLTHALLLDLEQRLLAVQPSIQARLAPGLDETEMEALTDPLELRIPPEGRVWWSWHNGISSGTGATSEGLVRAFFLLSLADAVETYYERQRIAGEIVGADPSELWPRNCLPFAVDGGGGVLTIDCSDPVSRSSPIVAVDWHGPRPFPRADSLGQVVTWWIDAIDTGIYEFDRERMTLSAYHWERVPRDRLPFV